MFSKVAAIPCASLLECFSIHKCISAYVKVFITATYEEFTAAAILIFPTGQGLIEAKNDNSIPYLGASNLGAQIDQSNKKDFKSNANIFFFMFNVLQ